MTFDLKSLSLVHIGAVIAIILILALIVLLILFIAKKITNRKKPTQRVTFKGKWIEFNSDFNNLFGGKWHLERGVKVYRPWFGKSPNISNCLGGVALKENECVTIDMTATPDNHLGVYHELNIYSYPSLSLIESIPMFQKGTFKSDNADTDMVIMIKTVGSSIPDKDELQVDICITPCQDNVDIKYRLTKKTFVYPQNLDITAFDDYYNSLLTEWGQGYFCTGRGKSEVTTVIPKSKFLWTSSTTLQLRPGEWVLIVYPNNPVSWFNIKSQGVPDYSENTYINDNHPIDHIIYSQQGYGGIVDINMTHIGNEGLNFYCYIFTNN